MFIRSLGLEARMSQGALIEAARNADHAERFGRGLFVGTHEVRQNTQTLQPVTLR